MNVIGINDENTVVIKHNKGLLHNAIFNAEGNVDILANLKNREFEVSILVLGGEKITIKFNLPTSIVIFNSIGIAEGHQTSLGQLSKLLSQTKSPIINHPKNVTLTYRDTLEKTLAEVKGIVVPKCLRLTPLSMEDVNKFRKDKAFSFPILFRPVIEQAEKSLLRVNNMGDIDKLQRYAFDGVNQYYMTAYLNYQSNDKFYRKMRFLIIGDEIIPRHLILSPSWQIHTEDKSMTQNIIDMQQREEIRFLGQISLTIGSRLLAIKKAFGLDYFGVDCAIDAIGHLIIFEANPYSMVGLGKNTNDHEKTIVHIYDSLSRLIKIKAAELT